MDRLFPLTDDHLFGANWITNKANDPIADFGRDALAKAAGESKERARRLAALAEKADQEASAAERVMAAATEQAESALQLAQEAATDVTEAGTVLAGAEALLEETKTDLETVRKSSAASEKAIRTLAFSPDSEQLATGGDDHLIHIWDSDSGQALDTLEGAGAVWCRL